MFADAALDYKSMLRLVCHSFHALHLPDIQVVQVQRAIGCKIVKEIEDLEADIHAYIFEQTDVQRTCNPIYRWGSHTVITT